VSKQCANKLTKKQILHASQLTLSFRHNLVFGMHESLSTENNVNVEKTFSFKNEEKEKVFLFLWKATISEDHFKLNEKLSIRQFVWMRCRRKYIINLCVASSVKLELMYWKYNMCWNTFNHLRYFFVVCSERLNILLKKYQSIWLYFLPIWFWNDFYFYFYFLSKNSGNCILLEINWKVCWDWNAIKAYIVWLSDNAITYFWLLIIGSKNRKSVYFIYESLWKFIKALFVLQMHSIESLVVSQISFRWDYFNDFQRK